MQPQPVRPVLRSLTRLSLLTLSLSLPSTHFYQPAVDPAAFDGDTAVQRLCRVPCPPSTVLLPQLPRHRGEAPTSLEVPLQDAVKLLGQGISLAGTGSLLGGGPASWEVSAAVHKGRSGSATQAADLQGADGAVSLQVARRWVEVRLVRCVSHCKSHVSQRSIQEMELPPERRSGAPPGRSAGFFCTGGADAAGEQLATSLRVHFPATPPPQLAQQPVAARALTFDDLFSGDWEAGDEATEASAAAADGVDTSDTTGEADAGAAAAAPPDVDTPPGESLAALLAALDATSAGDVDFAQGLLAPSLPMPSPAAPPAAAQPAQQSWAVTAPPTGWQAEFKAIEASPGGLAYPFPYKLDAFQQQAIVHLEAGNDVFVAAHTSAGKTVAAVYALALATARKTKAIYTSPIKTISNQKYRDFAAAGFDTGLLTGDVALNPSGACLVMTTEVLRSMLYRGSDTLRDLEYVVFDEVHYVNDAERGVVWEEALILLPRHVTLVCLSATVPNVPDFADWVGRVRKKHVHVCGTTKRPVPLTHVVWFANRLFPVADSNTGWSTTGYRALSAEAAAAKKKTTTAAPGAGSKPGGGGAAGRPGSGSSGGGGGGGGGQQPQRSSAASGIGGSQGAAALVARQVRAEGGDGVASAAAAATAQLRPGEKSAWLALVRHMQGANLLPSIVFCFSKRRCDALGDSLAGVLDFTSGQEKAHVTAFCSRAFGRLSASDLGLPQLQRVRGLLLRGIGVHHAGLLPLLKETVECLFCDGTLKLLFATETFAMGVNAPARSVVFSALRKHDGTQWRDLSPGEFTQMSGRAGRRGVDVSGTVILVPDSNASTGDGPPEEGSLRRLITGTAQPLVSQFRLTYGMVLAVLRIEHLRMEDMLRASFAEARAQREVSRQVGHLAKVAAALKRATAAADTFSGVDPAAWAAAQTAARLSAAAVKAAEGEGCASVALSSRYAAAALKPGRLLWVHTPAPLELVLPALLLRQVGPQHGGGIVVMLFPWGGPPVNVAAPAPAQGTAPPGASQGAQLQVVRSRKDEGEEDPWAALGGGGGKKGGKAQGSAATSAAAAASTALPPGLPCVVDACGGSSACIAWLPMDSVVGLCTTTLAAPPHNLSAADCDAAADARQPGALSKCGAAMQAAAAAASRSLNIAHPIADLSLGAPHLVTSYTALGASLGALADAMPAAPPPLPGHPEWCCLASAIQRLSSTLDAAGAATSDAALERMPDYRARLGVLSVLGHVASDVGGNGHVVTVKGRAAIEVNTADELLLTELVFNGVLAQLTAPQCAALLSAFVLQERSDVTPSEPLPPALDVACGAAWDMAVHLAQLQAEHGVQLDAEAYPKTVLHFGLVEAVLHWAEGMSFAEVAGYTDIPEGTIVRCVTRLHETCRELGSVARLIGDAQLGELVAEAATAVKRDIVFCSSLYVAGLAGAA